MADPYYVKNISAVVIENFSFYFLQNASILLIITHFYFVETPTTLLLICRTSMHRRKQVDYINNHHRSLHPEKKSRFDCVSGSTSTHPTTTLNY